MGDHWGRSLDLHVPFHKLTQALARVYSARTNQEHGKADCGGRGGSVGSMTGTDSIGERVCPADRNEEPMASDDG
jgi:hypothetical protein